VTLRGLRRAVWEANREIGRAGLAPLTWGNASGVDRARGLVVIKPSGVPYRRLAVDDMVVVDMDGAVVDGRLRPSSDTATHLVLYRAFPSVGGIVHTHAPYATAFAQAMREIPVLGTTHADHFRGVVPLTRPLDAAEVRSDYEAHTGRVIVERLGARDPLAVPAVLVARHGPFTWGRDVGEALGNALALESVAQIGWLTAQLAPDVAALDAHLLDRHHARKHGPAATYGQS
jgi:L-ribulose-5-phosphate 4-epimerase